MASVGWPDASAVFATRYAQLADALEPHHEQYRKVQAEINRLQEQLVIIKMAALSDLATREGELGITHDAAVAVC
jgi:predicted patatin/cPLA2 family phospholipase